LNFGVKHEQRSEAGGFGIRMLFPGFRPEQTVRGIFGDPKARVITLKRRSKKRLVDVHMRSSLQSSIAMGPSTFIIGAKTMRQFVFVCTALVLATSAYGQPNDGHKAAKKHARVAEASQAGQSSQELSSDQIRASIVGNTVVGIEGGEAYAEFLRPNRSLSGRARSGAYSGEWRISGNRICFLYKEDKKGWDCSHGRAVQRSL
jgi:hypothetical protein